MPDGQPLGGAAGAAGSGGAASSLLGSLGGATPWGAIAQAGAGIAQGIIGAIQAHRAQKRLEALKTPTYTPAQSILDYYNQAKARYSQSPYQSQLYKMQQQNIQRGIAQGLSTLSQGRGAIAGVSSLIQGQNDASLKAAAAAEQQQNQNLQQLGRAAGAQAGEMNKVFQYNQLAPYQKQYNLLAAKAGGMNQLANTGFSNIFGGLQNISNYQLAKQIYGG